MRVLKWIIDRVEGTGQGTDNVIGITPAYNDLTWTGLPFTEQQFNTVTSIDKAAWAEELALHTELFKQLEHHLPKALTDTKTAIEKRLAA